MAVLRSRRLLGALWIFWQIMLRSVSSEYILITSPKHVRFNVASSVICSVGGLRSGDSNVTLSLQETFSDTPPIFRKTLYFEKNGVKNLTFTLLPNHVSSSADSLLLTLEGGDLLRETDIMIKRDVGFLIIYTDKPVYSPTQTVKYRVIALDEHQRMAPWPVHLDIVSPNGIIVDQFQSLSSESAFSVRSYRLHKYCMHGKWKIRASFKENVQFSTQAEAEFDVKEYVLPKFTIKMKISPESIIKTTKEIQISMEATYLFGKGIDGESDIRIGLKNGDVIHKLLKIYHAKFTSGRAEISINTSDLSDLQVRFQSDMSRLYVEANVTDYAYGELQYISNYTVPIARETPTCYIKMDDNQYSFLPLKTFLLKGRVVNIYGAPIADVNLNVNVFNASQGYLWRMRLSSGSDGVFQTQRQMPDTQTVRFEIVTLGHRNVCSLTHVAYKLTSSQILLQENLRADPAGINIGYVATDTVSHMTVLVESRGQLVFSDSFPIEGTDMRSIRFDPSVYKELSPFATVSAFYADRSHLVLSTLLLDVPDQCLEEISLKYTSRKVRTEDFTKSPGHMVRFQLEGANNTKVGLIAVDKSVYVLEGRKPISRSMLFEYLGSHSLASMKNTLVKTDQFRTWEANGFTFNILDLQNNLLMQPPLSINVEAEIPEINGGAVALKGTNNRDSLERDFETVRVPARDFFPETWFFEDYQLTSRRRSKVRASLKRTLPDSTTTWTVQAVGVSSQRGICVSNPIDFVAFKDFFVDLQLPFKVVRLEAVKLKFSIFNYRNVQSRVVVRLIVPQELCLVETNIQGIRRGRKAITYNTIMYSNSTLFEYKLVPLKPGHFNITIAAHAIVGRRTGRRDKGGRVKISDKVTKTLYVVPEGRPVSKTVTFQLDPSALLTERQILHDDNTANAHQGETIRNTWDLERNEQTTLVDMALPNDTIPGTSHSNLFAYGDLLGDVVHSVILESRSLMEDTESGGRRVLGDLAPVVHTLHYLNKMELLSAKLRDQGKVIVQEGVSQLLSYRNDSGAFILDKERPESTWFTAAVLQTLCVVKSVEMAFVDDKMIETGAKWILDQIEEDGGLSEQDPRRKWMPEKDASMMLASEALMFLRQCRDNINEENEAMLEAQLWSYIEENLDLVTSTLALSKVSYVLELVSSPFSQTAVEKLLSVKKQASDGIYWSDFDVEEKPSTTAALYQPPVDAVAVESTSFALMTLLMTGRLKNVRPVVTWLVQQRGRYGAFVGAMDTVAATQALVKYSLKRQRVQADLQCNITSKQSDKYLHTIDFSSQESVLKKGVPGVPTGDVYQFDSRGTRLGQIQLDTKYNVAVGKNDHCPFNLTVSRTPFAGRTFNVAAGKLSSLCNLCNLGCQEDTPINESINHRDKRSSRQSHSASIICIKVCLSPLSNRTYHNIRVNAGLLSGYDAMEVTHTEMALMTKRRAASYSYQDGVFSVLLDRVPEGETTCFGFHARDRVEVEFQQPAVVTVKEEEKREPSCSLAYDVSDTAVTLPVLCSNPTKRHKGECMCTTGTCGRCHPGGTPIKTRNIRRLLCNKDYVFKVQTVNKEDDGAWYHLITNVDKTSKLGRDRVVTGQTLMFSTPKYCDTCPDFSKGTQLYVMGREAERLKDDEGTEHFRYVVNSDMIFINVTTDGKVKAKRATKEHYVKHAIRRGCKT